MGRKTELSEDELNLVLEFANSLYQGVGVYSPWSQRDIMLKNNGNSQMPTLEDLTKELGNSNCDYTKLAEYSQFMATFDTIYAKTLRYYMGLLSFDLTYTCTNAKASDYTSKAYTDDVMRVRKFFDNFDYKREFQRIGSLMLERDVVYTWFRNNNKLDAPINLGEKSIERFALQILPQNHCCIDGYFNGCTPLFSFDLSYFDSPNVDIDLFPNYFKKKIKETLDNSKQRDWIPSTRLGARHDIYGSQWVQTSPIDGAYCFKFDSTTAEQKPPFVAMIKSCLSNDEYEALAKQKAMCEAYLIIAGEIGTMTNQSNKQDLTKFTPNTMGNFLSLVNSGLNKAIKPIALPLENIKTASLDSSDVNCVSNKFKVTAGQGASASELVFHNENLSQFAMQNAIENDYAFISTIYYQFSNFLNYYVNKKTKKFKFNFTLSGLNRQWYKEKKKDMISTMADKGILLPTCYWSSCLDINPFDMERALEQAHNESTLKDNLTLLLNVNTMNNGGESNVGGRPKNEIGQGSDITEQKESLG